MSNGITFAGKFIQLNADISVSQKISDSDMSKFFSGTFDGNGHTINANIEEHDEDYVALFSTINGATIKNLTVAGSMGVVGCSIGSGNIF